MTSVVADAAPPASSNSVPLPVLPPCAVVPKRSPLASISRPLLGAMPFGPVNVTRVVMTPVPNASSNTVPSPALPPSVVVPNRLPAGSTVTLACGPVPVAPVNEASVVMVGCVTPSSPIGTSVKQRNNPN